jgi:DNA-directed RNA polymerase specialized sigma24 family protein
MSWGECYLPGDQGRWLALRDDGLTFAEIAEQTDVGRDRVAVGIYEARRRLARWQGTRDRLRANTPEDFWRRERFGEPR